MRKIAVLGLFIFTGCSIFNAYSSDFTYPKTTAYQASLDITEGVELKIKTDLCLGGGGTTCEK